jgi:hypothetical protein
VRRIGACSKVAHDNKVVSPIQGTVRRESGQQILKPVPMEILYDFIGSQ